MEGMAAKCPGQDNRDIKIEIVECPHCGYSVEIFSDEIKTRCPECKAAVSRARLPSCVDWCKAARVCAGEERRRQGQAPRQGAAKEHKGSE